MKGFFPLFISLKGLYHSLNGGKKAWFESILTLIVWSNPFLRTLTNIVSPISFSFSMYLDMSWMFWMSTSSTFSMMSPPHVISWPLMLAVLSPPNIPAFLAGLKSATEITKNPLVSVG